MLRFLTDENFDGDILRGLFHQNCRLDIVRVQDVGLMGNTDPEMLQWAAENGRVILSHDAKTLHGYAYERVRLGLSMPGVCHVSREMPIDQAIDEILIAAECATEADFDCQVRYLPF
jgi:hypothetical protein